MSFPAAPKKEIKTQSRILDMNRKNIKNLRRSGKNVAEMFEPNEYVEQITNFKINPTNFIEHPIVAYREGMVTPIKQKKQTNPFGAYGQLPSESNSRRKQNTRRRKSIRRRRSEKN